MYERVVTTGAASVLSEGLALPEDERARVAAESFASRESPDPDDSAEQALAWALGSTGESSGSRPVGRRASISPLPDTGSSLHSTARESLHPSR